MIFNVANLLTILRVLFIPLIIFIFFLDSDFMRKLAALFFLIASITDYLDGFIARKLDIEMWLGFLSSFVYFNGKRRATAPCYQYSKAPCQFSPWF